MDSAQLSVVKVQLFSNESHVINFSFAKLGDSTLKTTKKDENYAPQAKQNKKTVHL